MIQAWEVVVLCNDPASGRTDEDVRQVLEDEQRAEAVARSLREAGMVVLVRPISYDGCGCGGA